MRELLEPLARFTAEGEPPGRAVVSAVWGSAPRPAGACLLATADGRLVGSVSGGCVENAAALEVAEAIRAGAPRHVRYGVTDETAWSVGLACGGTITVWIEPAVRPEIAAGAGAGGFVLSTIIDGRAPGAAFVTRDDGTVEGPLPPVGAATDAHAALEAANALKDAIVLGAQAALARGASGTEPVKAPDWTEHLVLHELFPRRRRLVIVGAVHLATALVPLATRVGFACIVCDGREAYLRPELFPEAERLVRAWPAEAFAELALDPGTAVVVLSHDPRFDEPACELALRSRARYVGAIGSKKTQRQRRERLRGQGFDDAALARLHGPIGLDLGGREPGETALAILAEIVAAFHGASGGSLRGKADGG
ncbi:MAG: XdhC family protein [Gemmatimonadales bacterium]|nr:XdhC family protein [Gemmatimonadales bacterium]